MKSIADIQEEIIQAKEKEAVLSGLTSTSKVAVWRLWAYVIATVAWLQYKAWDTYQIEMNETIKTQKLYTLEWWQGEILGYRHGQTLNNMGSYDNGNMTEGQIKDTQIISSAAVRVVKINNQNTLLIKVAKLDANNNLIPISPLEKAGLEAYIAKIKPAGTYTSVFTGNADKLKITVRFYYNALIISDDGKRVDGTNDTPIYSAIKSYLQNLPFDGVLRLSALTDVIQKIDGCANAQAYLESSSATYQVPKDFKTITDTYVSVAGYMDIDEADFNVNYINDNV